MCVCVCVCFDIRIKHQHISVDNITICIFSFFIHPQPNDEVLPDPEDIFISATSDMVVMVTPANSRRALPSEQVGTCNTTENSVDVYDSITVFDWEAGGGVGTTPGPEVRLTSVSMEDEPDFVCQPESECHSDDYVKVFMCVLPSLPHVHIGGRSWFECW